MRCFKGDVGNDRLCTIIIDALKSGPKSSKELLLICKEKYAGFWEQRHGLKKVIVSDSEVRYRVRRLLKEGLITKSSDRNYSCT